MTGSTRIRDATPADARAIASVHIDVWRSTYRGHFPTPRSMKGRSFYERMGGRPERERPYEIGGATITETGYVWEDTSPLRSRSAGGSSGSTQRM